MAMLPLVLSEVTDGLVRRVVDLLPEGNDLVQVGPGLALPIGQVKELLGGQATSTPSVLPRFPWGPDLESQDDAVQKAARALRTRPEAIVEASHQRWDRSLTDEREARLRRRSELETGTARTLQAVRGHVTRELLEELRPLLKDIAKTKRRSRS